MISIDVDIGNTYEQNNLFAKVVKLRFGSGPTFQLLPALNLSQIKTVTYDKLAEKTHGTLLVENYTRLTLDDLRKMDSDFYTQQEFTRNNLKTRGKDKAFWMIKLIIRKNQDIKSADIGYLLTLMFSPVNNLVIPPVVYYYTHTEKGEIKELEPLPMPKYLEFIKEFLAGVSSRKTGCALTIPYGISNSEIPALLDTYKDIETKVAVSDFHGYAFRTVYQSYQAVVHGVSGSKKSYSLREKNGEDYFVYAFDSKPYFGIGTALPSQNLLQYLKDINSFGPRHTNEKRSKEVIEKFKKLHPNYKYIPKIYSKEEFSYLKPKDKKYASVLDDCSKWVKKELGRTGDLNYRKDFEMVGLVESVSEIYSNVEDIEKHLSSKGRFSKNIDSLKSLK